MAGFRPIPCAAGAPERGGNNAGEAHHQALDRYEAQGHCEAAASVQEDCVEEAGTSQEEGAGQEEEEGHHQEAGTSQEEEGHHQEAGTSEEEGTRQEEEGHHQEAGTSQDVGRGSRSGVECTFDRQCPGRGSIGTACCGRCFAHAQPVGSHHGSVTPRRS